eukprot:5638048-Alexandrium_andersonii.AAC.1
MQKVITSVKRLVPKIQGNPELIKRAKELVVRMQSGVMKEVEALAMRSCHLQADSDSQSY